MDKKCFCLPFPPIPSEESADIYHWICIAAGYVNVHDTYYRYYFPDPGNPPQHNGIHIAETSPEFAILESLSENVGRQILSEGNVYNQEEVVIGELQGNEISMEDWSRETVVNHAGMDEGSGDAEECFEEETSRLNVLSASQPEPEENVDPTYVVAINEDSNDSGIMSFTISRSASPHFSTRNTSPASLFKDFFDIPYLDDSKNNQK